MNKMMNKIRTTFKVPKGLYPDQNGHTVGPDLGPNSLQRLSAHNKSLC